MGIPDSCRIISADDHINPSPLIYGERLPKEFRDRAPRVERRGEQEVVVFEGTERPVSGLSGAAGARGKDLIMCKYACTYISERALQWVAR